MKTLNALTFILAGTNKGIPQFQGYKCNQEYEDSVPSTPVEPPV